MNTDRNTELLLGERFGKLTVVAFDRYEGGQSWWLCKCDCGGEKICGLKHLRSGRTMSCGCLKCQRRGPYNWSRVELTEAQIKWLKTHYKHTKNKDIMEKLGLSDGGLHRLARLYGLKKSPQYIRKVQGEAQRAAKESHLKNGTYPPKGHCIPRWEEFCYKPGHTETAKQKEKRIAHVGETMRKVWKLERARVHFGIPQQTRLRVNAQNKNVISLRYNLRKRGYIIERGSMIAYYDSNTNRNLAIEGRKNGDKNYVAFQYRPYETRMGQQG